MKNSNQVEIDGLNAISKLAGEIADLAYKAVGVEGPAYWVEGSTSDRRVAVKAMFEMSEALRKKIISLT